jgi:hypothetical protein
MSARGHDMRTKRKRKKTPVNIRDRRMTAGLSIDGPVRLSARSEPV